MEFGLLGPLVVETGGSRVTITAGKQRVVLAALLLRAGQVVPSADLAAAVWDGCPPPSARVTLQNYVKRLRHALGAAGHERIVTSPAGYLIKIGEGELDLDRFRGLAAAGRAAAGAGEWAVASERLAAALALWRGRPLADVPSAVLAAQVPRLAGMRLDTVEARIDADLHLGRHREVVPELRSLAAAEPLREGLQGLLMLALYRSGQQAGALAAYRDARRHLAAKAGLEPGPALRELHQRMLRADPRLLPGTAPGAGGPPAGACAATAGPGAATAGPGAATAGCIPPKVQPQMLPGGITGFTGRSRELRALSAAMPGAGGGPVVITAIGGTAGVGKTALAVHWARQHAADFPAGQLYVNLRGFGPGALLPPAEALRSFLEALDIPAAQIPAGLKGRQALYRGLLAGQRILVVLDNARDPDQVRPLLPEDPAALVLVTSRSQLASLAVTHGARQIPLDVLTVTESRQMLARRLGPARVTAEPQAAGELIGLCARLPLALAITAARAAAHPSFPLAALAGELREAAGRLDVLSTGDEDATDVRAVFSWSYDSLDPAAARMFRLLGLHPGPDVTAPAAASLAGTGLAEARRLLSGLARSYLLAEPHPGRYAFHDLLRAYAAERAAAQDSEQERRAAVRRLLDHYLHTAHAAALLLNSTREPIALGEAAAGVTPERIGEAQRARDWFAAEHQVLLAVIALAANAGFDVHAWQLPWAVTTFLAGRGQWHELAAVQRSALEAATRLGDKAGQAVILRLSAHNCGYLGEFDQARDYLDRCQALHRELDDRAGEAWVQRSLGWVAGQQGHYAQALEHDRQALALFREIGDRPGEARTLNAVGWHCVTSGEYEQAREFCRQALQLFQELGDHYGEAVTWDSLGYAEHHLGRPADAAACYRRAIGMLRELGIRIGEANVLTRLGDTQRAAGDPGGARDAWQQALAILDDLRHPDAEQVRGKLRDLDTGGRAPAAG